MDFPKPTQIFEIKFLAFEAPAWNISTIAKSWDSKSLLPSEDQCICSFWWVFYQNLKTKTFLRFSAKAIIYYPQIRTLVRLSGGNK